MLDRFLDGKYNDLLDHAGFRIALLTVTFAVWAITALGVLAVAA